MSTTLVSTPDPNARASPPSPAEPLAVSVPPELDLHRLSVSQYHEMIDRGILGPRDPVELLDGLLVKKMPEDPVHAGLIDITTDVLGAITPAGWVVRPAHPITTTESEPEPDVVVARGSRREYLRRHPAPEDCALVIEIANSSVARDRGIKRALYARAGVPVYWIVVLPERAIDVYSEPTGPTAEPRYTNILRLADGSSIPVVIDGREVGVVAVADLLP